MPTQQHDHFVPGGSGHCVCLCPQCFHWLTVTYRGRQAGMCVCRFCPCGGHTRMISAAMPKLVTADA